MSNLTNKAAFVTGGSSIGAGLPNGSRADGRERAITYLKGADAATSVVRDRTWRREGIAIQAMLPTLKRAGRSRESRCDFGRSMYW